MGERKTRRERAIDNAILQIAAEKGYASIADLMMVQEAVASTELSHEPGYFDEIVEVPEAR